MRLKDLYELGRGRVSREYPDSRECAALLGVLLEDVLNLPRHSVFTDPSRDVARAACDLFLGCAHRLASGEPVQYVVGRAQFYGRNFNVSPSVLIPRPETEQLCRYVIEDARRAFPGRTGDVSRPLRILDLCTGSGCIAWTLALELPGSLVTGVDISPAALETARNQNLMPDGAGGSLSPTAASADLSPQPAFWGESGPESPSGDAPRPVPPRFVESDILRGPDSFDGDFDGDGDGGGDADGYGYDIIVSNPPYVRECERPLMRRNVLEHEPSLALFVPDGDPLKFFRAVRLWADRLLRKGGLVFLEQNEFLANETAGIFNGSYEARTRNDLSDRPRFTVARRL